MRIRAEISCGVYFLPSMSTFQSVPMWRLTEAMVRSMLLTAWRLAISPTRTSPDLENATTDGVVRPPSALAMTVGSPPSRTETTELVVPRSIPTARDMQFPPAGSRRTHSARGCGDAARASLVVTSRSISGSEAKMPADPGVVKLVSKDLRLFDSTLLHGSTGGSLDLFRRATSHPIPTEGSRSPGRHPGPAAGAGPGAGRGLGGPGSGRGEVG